MGSSVGGKADSVCFEQKGKESPLVEAFGKPLIDKDYPGESEKEQERQHREELCSKGDRKFNIFRGNSSVQFTLGRGASG